MNCGLCRRRRLQGAARKVRQAHVNAGRGYGAALRHRQPLQKASNHLSVLCRQRSLPGLSARALPELNPPGGAPRVSVVMKTAAPVNLALRPLRVKHPPSARLLRKARRNRRVGRAVAAAAGGVGSRVPGHRIRSRTDREGQAASLPLSVTSLCVPCSRALDSRCLAYQGVPIMIDFYQRARDLHGEMQAMRNDLHRHPELAFEEIRTSGIVARVLRDLGMEVQTGVGKTGVVGLLDGAACGPTVLIRADMDALPVHEQVKAEYTSTIPGRMHACGHDAHTAIGLAVARMLAENRAAIRGRVKFVFQPAEEIGRGALAMIRDGVLESPRPDYTLGLHMWSAQPVGRVSATPGPTMSAAARFNCVITGYGGHGAQPHETRDPIAAAVQIVSATQTIISRNVDPLDMAVVTVASIVGGDTYNIIPQQVELKGTIRTYHRPVYETIVSRLEEICTRIAAAFQCGAHLEVDGTSVSVHNDSMVSSRVEAVAARIVGRENVTTNDRLLVSDDMAYLMNDIPGCYFLIGSSPKDGTLGYPHHHPLFAVDDEALALGAAILAESAASFLMTTGE